MRRSGCWPRRLLVLAAWSPMQTRLVDQPVLATPEGKALPDFEMQRDTILAEARQIANGEIEAGFNPESTALAPRSRKRRTVTPRSAALPRSWSPSEARGSCSCASATGDFRARTAVERWMNGLLLVASLIAIFTTLGIVLSLLFESLRFFQHGPADRLPVRPDLEPADRDPRRPGRVRPARSARSRCSGARSSSARSSR